MAEWENPSSSAVDEILNIQTSLPVINNHATFKVTKITFPLHSDAHLDHVCNPKCIKLLLLLADYIT